MLHHERKNRCHVTHIDPHNGHPSAAVIFSVPKVNVAERFHCTKEHNVPLKTGKKTAKPKNLTHKYSMDPDKIQNY